MENPFDRLIRPLNSKHAIRAVVAFALAESGEVLRYEDGDPEEIKALKKKASAKKNQLPTGSGAGQAGESVGEGDQEAEGENIAGKAE